MGLIDKLKDAIQNKVEETPIIKVTMMGPRAVGKTSLMASIFSDTRESVAGTGVYFRPDKNTSKNLTIKKLQLQNIFAKGQAIQDIPNANAIDATRNESTFVFEMGRSGRAPSINIEITDFPGEYLTTEPEKVNKYIAESNVVMIAIDSPYLMEEDGIYNESKNQVVSVVTFLSKNKEVIKDKMILLVPLKCERYFHDDRLDDLDVRVKNAYNEIIKLCQDNNIICAITPIQTLGHVEFDSFAENTIKIDEIEKLSKFRFWGDKPRFLPMFCVQPLYYVLTYVANLYEWQSKQESGLFGKIKSSLMSYLKDDDEFLYEIKKMGSEAINGRLGYEIVVDNTIFKLK